MKTKLTFDELLSQAHKICKSCKKELHEQGGVSFYPHENGWDILGLAEKQWVYLKCTHCDYQNSLDTLGVKREK